MFVYNFYILMSGLICCFSAQLNNSGSENFKTVIYLRCPLICLLLDSDPGMNELSSIVLLCTKHTFLEKSVFKNHSLFLYYWRNFS